MSRHQEREAKRLALVAQFDHIDTRATEFMAANSAPGLAYAVVLDGQVIHSGGRGAARLAAEPGDGPAPGADTVFRIASMTKSFVAAAILILRDRGDLRLDDPVDAHIPELRGLALPTSDSRMPTIRDLLTMSAGWPTDDPWADREEPMTPQSYSALLAGGFTFNDAPGTTFEYSNLGYTMLGRVITNASGTQFQDFITANILQPLGMSSSGFRAGDVPQEHLADGHFFRDDRWQVELTSETGEFAALGGLFSSCNDLARWVGVMSSAFPARDEHDQAMPLSRASLREMQQGARKVPVSIAATTGEEPFTVSNAMYGFGLVVTDDPRIGVTVGHSGGYPGFGTHMCWHPESGIGVVALTNGRYGGAFRVATAMLRDLLLKTDSPTRTITTTDACRAASDVVDAVLDAWDDAALDGVVSANFDADIPRATRRAAVEAALAVTGPLQPGRSRVTGTSGSHLIWWREGATGWLRAEIRLTPQRPQNVQTLNIRAVHQPSEALLAAARALQDALSTAHPHWPAALTAAEALDAEPLLRAARLAFALDGAATLNPVPVTSASAHSATFELHSAHLVWELAVAIDATSGAVTSCSLSQRPLTADARAVSA
ncbi:MAG: beta-lactamase family protein [Actinomycetales bacterium]|nr:beta-lactamase family protein [Actinomycetales bacterium]